MEILQTIWNALTSENEMLVKIICLPLTFLEAYLYMLVFLTVLNIKSNAKQQITFVVSFSFIALLSLFFGETTYYTFINALSIPVLVLLIFKCGILKAVLSEVTIYIIVLLVSAFLVFAYSSILSVPAIATSTVPIHKLCLCALLYISLYAIYKLSEKFNINISILDRFKRRSNLLLISNFLIGSIAICVQYYLLFNHFDVLPDMLVFSSLFILLLYFLFSIYSLVRTSKLEQTEKELEKEKMFNKTLSTLHDNIRGFKHDFDNIVQAIGGYISTNNMDGLKTYYKDVMGDCQTNNNLSVLNPELINNPAIYSLLVDKYYKSEELGIKMNIEVMMDLSNLNIKIYELSRILGVLFDNALDASSKCDKKIVNITFRKDRNRNKDLIIIQNTYANKDIDINRIFEKGFSSKGDNNKEHGLGLWEVRKYLKKNTHLDLFTTKTDEFFTQQFEIYYE